ncbi:MAG: hypothetical protein K2X39_03775, partial [Silvanigrellaceae bacterium]|nr:hypothetical protein [Silvanigrellaceae bacterium]
PVYRVSRIVFLIVANPPYVSESQWENLCDNVKNFEPRLALVSGDNGLEMGKRILGHCLKNRLWSQDCLFTMELAEGHPKQLIHDAIALPQRYGALDVPKNTWLSLPDIDQKERFLCKIFC